MLRNVWTTLQSDPCQTLKQRNCDLLDTRGIGMARRRGFGEVKLYIGRNEIDSRIDRWRSYNSPCIQ